MKFWEIVFYGNTVLAWIIFGAGCAFLLSLLLLIRKMAATRLAVLAQKTSTAVDDLLIDLVRQTKLFFLLLVSIYAASHALVLPDRILSLLRAALVVAGFLQLGLWSNRIVSFWLTRYLQSRMAQEPSTSASLTVMIFVGRLVIWSVVALLALDNLGIEVTTLLAGIGIGGIAVALAVQSILQDLFSSLSIALDKPFVVGDFIVVGDILGTVEQIGIKTTRVRSLTGEQIIFTNSDLLNSRIRNFKRMFERRVLFTLGVVYQTPQEKLEAIPAMIREIIERQEKARFDRAHFKSFGDFALIFEVVYFVQDSDYNKYMDIQHAVNLDINRRFQAEGIDFAYPTQTIVVQPAGAMPGKEGGV